jgi:hypothetical protein
MRAVFAGGPRWAFIIADRKRVLVIEIVLAIPAIAGRWINGGARPFG